MLEKNVKYWVSYNIFLYSNAFNHIAPVLRTHNQALCGHWPVNLFHTIFRRLTGEPFFILVEVIVTILSVPESQKLPENFQHYYVSELLTLVSLFDLAEDVG